MFRKVKFQTKLIFFHILIVLFVSLTLSGLFYRYVVDVVTDRANDDFAAIAANVVNQFENHLYNMDKTALQVAANPSIVSVFSKTGRNPAENYFIREPVTEAAVVKLLNSYNFKRDGYARICLYNDDRDFVCTATTVTTNGGIQDFFDSAGFRKIQEFLAGNGNFVCFTPPHEDVLNDTGLSERRHFSVVRRIRDYSSNSLACGYVEVQDFEDRLDKIFGELSEGGYAAVMDERGELVYRSPSLRRLQDGQEEKVMEGLSRLVRDGGAGPEPAYHLERYLYWEKMDNAPYTVLFEKHRSSLLAPLIQFSMLLLAGMVLILFTAVLTEVLIIRRLSRPLREVHRSIRNMSPDKFRMDIDEEESSDELVQIQNSFNAVLTQLKESIEKQYTAHTNELKSHLFALQSQMNPHFLYNILAIISMEAGEDGNEKVQNMCAKLCGMLKFTSSMGDGFCTLQAEMDNAVNYMTLMKERYEELFEFSAELDPSLAQARIPKLILQPLCENCFKHSFKNTEPIWRIRVKVWRQDGQWRASVHDNGTGFSQDYLEQFARMKQEITFDNVRENLERISIGGLCIPNLYMRLKICYEDGGFLFELDNDAEGAVVVLGGKIND